MLEKRAVTLEIEDILKHFIHKIIYQMQIIFMNLFYIFYF